MGDVIDAVEATCDTCCELCIPNLERVRYFPRQLLTAEDMRVEQEYFRQRFRRHYLHCHGWGVLCGGHVEPAPEPAHPWQVRVCPTVAVTPQGDEAVIDDCVLFDLKLGMPKPEPCAVKWPCPPTGEMPSSERRSLIYLAVRYAECPTRPVRVPPAGCGCDELACEYSRIRDSFELKVLWEVPETHKKAKQADAAWCETLKQQGLDNIQRRHEWPTPPCPACECDPWVVLATVRLPASDKTDITAQDISPKDRRTLLSTQAVQAAIGCLA